MVLLRDPSLDSVLGGRPRQTTVPAVAAAVLVLTLVVGTLALVVLGGPRDHPAVRALPDPTPAPAAPTTEDSDTTPASRLTLPQPTGYVRGVPVGYPHSPNGAIAAAYGYSRIASGLDVDATLQAIEFFADPYGDWFSRGRAELADGLVAQRSGLGLSPVGSAGGVSFSITPAGYQLLGQPLEHASDDVRVLTLNIVSAVGVDGTHTSGTVVLDWNLRWIDDRWRVVAPYDGRDHDALAVAPMTSAARAAGWQEARGG